MPVSYTQLDVYKRQQMDDMLPALFRTKEMARVELLLNHLSTQSYEILEVNLQVLEHVSWQEIRDKRISFFFRLW